MLSHISMLKIAYSSSWLLHAQIARSAIWIEALFFIRCPLPGLEAAGLCKPEAPSPGAGSPAPAAAPSPAAGVGQHSLHRRLVGGADTILPCCWCRSCWCWRRGLLRQCSLVELISFADLPAAGLVQTKPQCTIPAHYVAIEEAKHFGRIVLKSIFCQIWFHTTTVDATSSTKLLLKTGWSGVSLL